eukprot:SAG31_NODE_6742_length_1903_cov_1.584257_1_plen_53_part_10
MPSLLLARSVDIAAGAVQLPQEMLDKPFMEQPSVRHLADTALAVPAEAGDLII